MKRENYIHNNNIENIILSTSIIINLILIMIISSVLYSILNNKIEVIEIVGELNTTFKFLVAIIAGLPFCVSCIVAIIYSIIIAALIFCSFELLKNTKNKLMCNIKIKDLKNKNALFYKIYDLDDVFQINLYSDKNIYLNNRIFKMVIATKVGSNEFNTVLFDDYIDTFQANDNIKLFCDSTSDELNFQINNPKKFFINKFGTTAWKKKYLEENTTIISGDIIITNKMYSKKINFLDVFNKDFKDLTNELNFILTWLEKSKNPQILTYEISDRRKELANIVNGYIELNLTSELFYGQITKYSTFNNHSYEITLQTDINGYETDIYINGKSCITVSLLEGINIKNNILKKEEITQIFKNSTINLI